MMLPRKTIKRLVVVAAQMSLPISPHAGIRDAGNSMPAPVSGPGGGDYFFFFPRAGVWPVVARIQKRIGEPSKS